MWEKLEEAFIETGLPYSRQGSYSQDRQLPESFFTFWNADSPEGGFYDNKAHTSTWMWYVYFYTSDPGKMYSELEKFITIAKEKGFKSDSRGKDAPSENPDYVGRYIRLTYVENHIGG